MKNPQFSNGEIYHVYNRGVEKRKVFMDDFDYLRFIYGLFMFNDKDAVLNALYYFNPRSSEITSQKIENENKSRKLLVDILIFTLMPNHFHLLLRQKKENGISKFMQKLGTGYTNYFNKKYERVGGLFQGGFKARLVKEDAHLLHLPFYIHTNPIDILNYGSRTSIMDGLEKYRWSSFRDYIGKENFPSVTNRKFYLEFFGGEKKYLKYTKKWLEEREKNIEMILDVKMD